MPDASPVIEFPDLDVVGIAAILAAIGVIVVASRGVNQFFKRVNEFFDDWYGTDGDDIHPERLGVLRRMTDIEVSLNQHIEQENVALRAVGAEVTEMKKKVDHELGRNSGSTTKDAAHEALRVVKEVQVQQEQEIIARRDWHARYETDQQAAQARLMTFFALVRRMIPLAPSEQAALWDQAVEAVADGNLTEAFPLDQVD